MNPEYRGMTVNERLYASNLIDAFDHAVAEKDLDKVKSILRAIELDDERSVQAILDFFSLTKE